MPRSPIFIVLALGAACAGSELPTAPDQPPGARAPNTATPPAPSVAAGASSPAAGTTAREALARKLALALAEPAFRRTLGEALSVSPYREGKILLSRFLEADGGAALGKLVGASGAVPLTEEERASARALEVYLPVPAHRAAWRGGDFLVATLGADGEAPLAYDARGASRVLDRRVPPATPVIAVVPVETDFSRLPPARGISTAATSIVSSAGLYLTNSHLRESFESWLKGSPEIEFLVLGQKGATDSLTSYQCVGEHSSGAYYFDQNALDWSGSVLAMSQIQLDAFAAAHPGQALRLFFMEDDDTPCEIRANNADLSRVIATVDSIAKGYAGGKDVLGGTVGRLYRNFLIAQKIYSVVASFIKSNDDMIGNAVEDVVTTERYAGYNWIIKGADGRTNGYVRLEMR